MGVLYHVEPLDEEMAGLLHAMGEKLPDADLPSRNPTPQEVRAVCDALRGYTVEYNITPKARWQAIIEGKGGEDGTILNIEKFNAAEDQPLPIWFEKGDPALILEIVKQLAKICGPLVVIPDTGDVPITVTANASVKKLLREWGA